MKSKAFSEKDVPNNAHFFLFLLFPLKTALYGAMPAKKCLLAVCIILFRNEDRRRFLPFSDVVCAFVNACRQPCKIRSSESCRFDDRRTLDRASEDIRLKETDYTVAELESATIYYRDQANALADQIKRDSDGNVDFAREFLQEHLRQPK